MCGFFATIKIGICGTWRRAFALIVTFTMQVRLYHAISNSRIGSAKRFARNTREAQFRPQEKKSLDCGRLNEPKKDPATREEEGREPGRAIRIMAEECCGFIASLKILTNADSEC